MDLADAIARQLATWDEPVVEAAIFGTTEPAAIAGAIGGVLDGTIAETLFYRTSVGAVAGVVLADGRRVVVKAHQPHVGAARLAAVHEVMRALADAGFPCPRPVAGPLPLGRGLATVEALVDDGEVRDGHEPAVRRELAVRIVELMRLVPPAPAYQPLGASWFSGLPSDVLWPRPHSPLFDFEATRAGAEEIDAIGAAARRVPRAGAAVVGHFDWRAEHARFNGDRMVVAYDWDSLHVDLEPVVVGAAAHAFCADWERQDTPAAPDLDELHAFVAEAEAARRAPFDGAERATLAASLVYSLAYTARCTHALGDKAGPRSRAFVELTLREAPVLLASAMRRS
jgi:hypothetical protein